MLPSLYKRGLAGGLPVINTDSVIFRYKDEIFEFPSYLILNAKHKGALLVKFDGVCYTAPVGELRALKEKHG